MTHLCLVPWLLDSLGGISMSRWQSLVGHSDTWQNVQHFVVVPVCINSVDSTLFIVILVHYDHHHHDHHLAASVADLCLIASGVLHTVNLACPDIQDNDDCDDAIVDNNGDVHDNDNN